MANGKFSSQYNMNFGQHYRQEAKREKSPASAAQSVTDATTVPLEESPRLGVLEGIRSSLGDLLMRWAKDDTALGFDDELISPEQLANVRDFFGDLSDIVRSTKSYAAIEDMVGRLEKIVGEKDSEEFQEVFDALRNKDFRANAEFWKKHFMKDLRDGNIATRATTIGLTAFGFVSFIPAFGVTGLVIGGAASVAGAAIGFHHLWARPSKTDVEDMATMMSAPLSFDWEGSGSSLQTAADDDYMMQMSRNAIIVPEPRTGVPAVLIPIAFKDEYPVVATRYYDPNRDACWEASMDTSEDNMTLKMNCLDKQQYARRQKKIGYSHLQSSNFETKKKSSPWSNTATGVKLMQIHGLLALHK